MKTAVLDPSDITRSLQRLLDAGFELPFHVAIIAKNGEMGLGVWKESLTDVGLNFELVALHAPSGAFVLPVNLMVVDKRTEAARIVFDVGRDPVVFH